MLETRLPDSKRFRRDLSEERQGDIPLDDIPDGQRPDERQQHQGTCRGNLFSYENPAGMSSRKADTEGIDEALLLDSIGRRKQDGSVQPQETKDASIPKARRRNRSLRRKVRKREAAARDRMSITRRHSSNATRSKHANASISAGKYITRFPVS